MYQSVCVPSLSCDKAWLKKKKNNIIKKTFFLWSQCFYHTFLFLPIIVIYFLSLIKLSVRESVFLSVFSSVPPPDVVCFCAVSRTVWLLHRLRGDALVPGPGAAGGRHSVWPRGGRVGARVRVRRAAVGDPSVARQVRHGPAVPDQEDPRWARDWRPLCSSISSKINLW